MKIAVISYYAVTNIGDIILTDVVCSFLKGQSISKIDINGRYKFRYSGILGKIEKFILLNYVKFRGVDKCLENRIKKCDAILFAGGEILDALYTDCVYKIEQIINIAEKYHIPVAFNACGIAIKDSSDSRVKILKKVLSSSNVISISVRERLKDVKELFNPVCDVHLVSDTAVWCKECYDINMKKCSGIHRVGINIIRKEVYEQYFPYRESIVDVYVKIYKEMENQGYECYFFTNGVLADESTLQEVISTLHLSFNKVVSPKSRLSGRDFVQMLTHFDFIVSCRLHTSICCFSLGIPTVAIPWDDKFKEFYSSSGQLSRCIDSKDNLATIIRKISSIIKKEYSILNYDEFRNTVKYSLLNLLSTINKNVFKDKGKTV